MSSSRIRIAIVLWMCTLSGAVFAADKVDPRLSFFVATHGVNGSANLGGLAGADARCQALADSVGAGNRQWRAYLSTSGREGQPAVDARDRIGHGPWYNARGHLIARDLDELHSDRHDIDRFSALDHLGARVARAPHDVLTGSDAQGRLALIDGKPATCDDWTADGDGVAMIGHDDRFDADSWGNKRFHRWQGSWNAEHATTGCDAKRLTDTSGAGGFYCFAVDAVDLAPEDQLPAADPRRYTFERGLTVNHWIGDNLDPSMLANADYGNAWFGADDVDWIAAQGFDHIRVRVAGHVWITAKGDLDADKLAPFDRLLQWTRARGLGVVLAMDSLPGYRAHIRGGAAPTDVSSPFTDEDTRGDAAYLWWLVARRYADVGEQLRLELINNPDAPDAASIRAFNRETLEAVRRTNPTRWVYLTSRNGTFGHLDDIELLDERVAPTISFWDPELFTFQIDERVPRITFPGRIPDMREYLDAGDPLLAQSNTEINVATLEARIAEVADAARRVAPGRTLHIGQFGVYRSADDASARAFIAATRAAFERAGFEWSLYDYHTGCAVRDDQGNGGATRILEGLKLTPRATP